jgi:cytochrome o ubiquinol oxidase operon protein cyoD
MNVSATIRPAEPRGVLQSYVTGVLLALALTLAPFALVMSGASGTNAVAGIFALAVIQIVVHVVFFLHLGRSPDQRWNLMAFVFTALIVGILVGGSYWVMYHLDHNMMPAMQMGDLVESNLVKA